MTGLLYTQRLQRPPQDRFQPSFLICSGKTLWVTPYLVFYSQTFNKLYGRINKEHLIAVDIDGTMFTTTAEAIHICFHNGWYLLIMPIISLFNAFSWVADMKQMVNLQAYSKHNMLHVIEISSKSRAAVTQHFVKATLRNFSVHRYARLISQRKICLHPFV